MGCDIHLFIEYKERYGWNNFGKRINPGRNYDIFAKLANVRNYDGSNIISISEPRGLPDNSTYVVRDYNKITIDDALADADGYCTKKQAKSWGGEIDEYNRIDHPDWHSHSWVTTQELKETLDFCKNSLRGINAEWEIVLEILEGFEKRGHEARIVFMFDN